MICIVRKEMIKINSIDLHKFDLLLNELDFIDMNEDSKGINLSLTISISYSHYSQTTSYDSNIANIVTRK